MLVVQTPQDLKQHIGKTLGPSEWITVDQAMIDKFAEATGDHQWIHVDVERAKKEMPGGKTIAHGYLTLSLVPRLGPQLIKVEKRKRGINYGSNKVRFTNTVPAGSRIRLKQTIKNVEDVEGNVRDGDRGRRAGAPGAGRRGSRHPVRLRTAAAGFTAISAGWETRRRRPRRAACTWPACAQPARRASRRRRWPARANRARGRSAPRAPTRAPAG